MGPRKKLRKKPRYYEEDDYGDGTDEESDKDEDEENDNDDSIDHNDDDVPEDYIS